MSISHSPHFLSHLHTISWFSNCGENNIGKETIVKEISKTKWENLVLNHRGDATAMLSIHHPIAYKEWNNLAAHLKQHELPKLVAVWEASLKQHDLVERDILMDVSFNVLNFALLKAYEPYVEIPRFYHDLFAIYEQGKLPYGWKGTRDNGSFLVY